jgi:hypothetical protein
LKWTDVSEVHTASIIVLDKYEGVTKRGHGPSPRTMEALTQNDPPHPRYRDLQPKQPQTLWVQLPDIHLTKVLFAKDKFPDGINLPSAAVAGA